jgi:hypothetical protein
MKKSFLVFITTTIILLIGLNTCVYASEVIPGGEYLEMHQWGALEDILADWKTGNITTDECALYGCYIIIAQEPARADKNIKSQMIPKKYKLDKKSFEEGPYFFIYELYKHENSLGKAALEEFRNSEWSDFEFIENLTNNKKFNQIILATPIESYDGKNFRDYYAILAKALKNNVIMPETIQYQYWLAITGVNIKRYEKYITPFKNKYNLMFKNNGFDCINELSAKFPCSTNSEKHRKISNIIHYLYYSRCKTGRLYKINNDGFKLIGIGVDDNLLDQYSNWLSLYKKKMVLYGFKEPINFSGETKKTLEVYIQNSPCPFSGLEDATAFTLATPADVDNTPFIKTGCFMTFYVPTINNDIKVTPPEKHVIHELMHSITYSYDDKTTSTKDYHWYLPSDIYNDTDCVNVFGESTTGWAEDSFFEGDASYKMKLSTIFKSNKYFFEDYKLNNFIFPAVGMFGGKKYYYSYGYFFNYLCRQISSDFVKKLWETAMTMKFTNALKTIFESKNQKVAEVFHDFAIRNYCLNKIDGSFPDENIFKKANEIWGNAVSKFPVLEIKDTWLPNISTAEKKIPPYGTKIYKLPPPDPTLGYFDKCVTLDFSWNKDVSDIKFSVISCWNDIQNSGSQSIGYLNTPLLYGGQKARYQYFTKKGLNPTQFIILVTNGDITEHSFTVNISYSDSTINPALTPAQLIGNGGTEFINAAVALYESGNFKASANRIVNELKKLFESYSTLPKSDSQLAKDFIGQQIIKKLNELNLVMHTAINQMHDLRYQYYLYKKSCIEKILKASSPPALDLPHLTDSSVTFLL